jgi:hypothetical protein
MLPLLSSDASWFPPEPVSPVGSPLIVKVTTFDQTPVPVPPVCKPLSSLSTSPSGLVDEAILVELNGKSASGVGMLT